MTNEIERIELGISISVEKDTPTLWVLRVFAKDKPTKDYITSVIKEQYLDFCHTQEQKEETFKEYKEVFDEGTLCVYQCIGSYYPDALTLLENNFWENKLDRKHFFEKIAEGLYKAMIRLTDNFQMKFPDDGIAFYLETKEETEETFYFSKFFLHEVLKGLRQTALDMMESIDEGNEGDTKPGMPFSFNEYTHITRTKFDFDRREYRLEGKFLTIRDQKDRG